MQTDTGDGSGFQTMPKVLSWVKVRAEQRTSQVFGLHRHDETGKGLFEALSSFSYIPLDFLSLQWYST